MSWKGHKFTLEDAPRTLREPQNAARLQAWIAEQTEKHAIVGKCKCGYQLVDGEKIGHGLTHASNGNVRSAVGTVLMRTPDEIDEILALVAKLR